ncbi:hypothetical protein ACF1AJ_19025 [Leifsonia sp. NPDC014704]|uniref:hypothetical protein n=1 Tax=Leifsonia sp. NPDC014704 TaxID=3364123 RepID=UPI0036F468DE
MSTIHRVAIVVGTVAAALVALVLVPAVVGGARSTPAVVESAASAQSSPAAVGLVRNEPSSPTRVASWRLLSSSPSSQDITIGVVVGGSCDEFDKVRVTETGSAVTIAPIVQTVSLGACADSLKLLPEVVHLSGPLGDRQLLHAEAH